MKKTILATLLLGTAFTGYHLMPPTWQAVAQARLGDIVPLQRDAGETVPASPWASALISAARDQIGITLSYDGSYAGLAYPMGDIDRARGVCTDVIIRALRDAHQLDLQRMVHEDMRAAFASYPKNWGLSRPDRNIDHRRVPNLRRFLERARAIAPTDDYQPGDIVTWTLGPGLPHIGILSDKRATTSGNLLVIHNVGAGTREEDFLNAYPITGHYRLDPALQG